MVLLWYEHDVNAKAMAFGKYRYRSGTAWTALISAAHKSYWEVTISMRLLRGMMAVMFVEGWRLEVASHRLLRVSLQSKDSERVAITASDCEL